MRVSDGITVVPKSVWPGSGVRATTRTIAGRRVGAARLVGPRRALRLAERGAAAAVAR